MVGMVGKARSMVVTQLSVGGSTTAENYRNKLGNFLTIHRSYG